MDLPELLDIRPGVTAVTGGGGKTTLLRTLGEALAARGSRVLLCASTKLFPFQGLENLVDPQEEALGAALEARRLVCAGAPVPGTGKLTAPGLPMARLAALADCVLAEADGSAGRPLKAHAAHEPVVPREANQIIQVVGASGFGRPVREAVHRPERFCALTGLEPEDPVTPEALAEVLRAKGDDVMHVTSVDDLVDGELDRYEAYSKAQKEISSILEANPGIQSVIDLHRDGVAEGTRLVTEINGKTMARFMFFNGLSRTKKNGSIDYLYNPYIEDNLALTLQLKLKSEQYYPGLARNIYLRSLRYNLHLSDKALLIEAGAQTNTLQEMMNTMEPLSDILDKVFDP